MLVFTPSRVIHRVVREYLGAMRPRRIRTFRRFCEQELVIPEGEYAGEPFDASIQPYSGLFLDAVDSGLYRRYWVTGPAQSGKTLLCVIAFVLWYLFEHVNSVVFGVPTMRVSRNKWTRDLLPAIEQTRYRELLPRRGAGSKGGTQLEEVQFAHGRALMFLGGGGRDEERAGVTAPVVVVTEADKLQGRISTSEETDRLSQIESRNAASGDRGVFLGECTVTTAHAPTWHGITEQGTNSRIVVPCPHCNAWTTPEREHLVGWQTVDNKLDAVEKSHFICPACQQPLTDRQRVLSNRQGKLVHAGQEIGPDGVIHGRPKRTDTLGFRWNAYNNLFVTAGWIGGEEYVAKRAESADAERKMKQLIWAVPYQPPERPTVELDETALTRRTGPWPKGTVPAQAKWLTVGVDVRKHNLHWCASAWWGGATGVTLDYEIHEVRSDDLGEQLAVLNALRSLRDQCLEGWTGETGGRRVPDRVFIDSGYLTSTIYEFVDSCASIVDAAGNPRFMAVKGAGVSQYKGRAYARPSAVTRRIVEIGESYHLTLTDGGLPLVILDADYWKTWLHSRLAGDVHQPGALVFFRRDPRAHTTWVKQLTSEQERIEDVPGVGYVTSWRHKRGENHWLDAQVYACVAAHHAGVRLAAESDTPARPVEPSAYFAAQRRAGRRRSEK